VKRTSKIMISINSCIWGIKGRKRKARVESRIGCRRERGGGGGGSIYVR